MASRINPFHNLYLSEAIGPRRFVDLFSALFVEHATALFQPGHVVLQGLQGSGKTMLLNLLKPDTRIAYYRANEPFPVPQELSRFIGAGINLRKAGLIDFGQLVLPETSDEELRKLALQYGDFLNYWILADLLNTLKIFQGEDEKLWDQIGLHLETKRLDQVARVIATEDCFFDYLNGCDSFANLCERVGQRIVTYRKFININLDPNELPTEIVRSTTVAGEPISRASEALKRTGVIDADVEIYVRIDQYEQLATLNTDARKFGNYCRDVTHKVLASRDARVSYRLGTRHYAWPSTPTIFGTSDVLENKRDYSLIDIDDKLRRKENPRTWIFPAFAQDIFRRRLEQTSYAKDVGATGAIEKVFGKTLSAMERALRYVPSSAARRQVLKIDEDATCAWREFLEQLGQEDPLAARFADAWVHQKDPSKRRLKIEPPKLGEPYPWDKKKYWIKERNEQALLQLASANRQQLIWSGTDDLFALSGGNILVFLFLCQQIWDGWLRDTRGDNDISDVLLPSIADPVQTQGIREASEEWMKKVKEGSQAERRTQFLGNLGQHFYRVLTDDKSMSNPGANGFSVSIDELNEFEEVKAFLQLCVEFGDLYDAPHTSKNKGEARKKYYLAPILSPYFRIPYQHTKEPLYVRAEQVRAWIFGTPLPSRATTSSPTQLQIFGGD